MSEPTEPIIIPVESSGLEGVTRLVTEIERLHQSIDKLAGVRGMSDLSKQVEQLQTSMSTGFRAIELQMSDFDTKIRAQRQTAADKLVKDQIEHDNKLHAQANKFHDKQIDIEVAAENRRAATLQALIEKRDTSEYAARASAALRLQTLIEKRDVEEYAARSAASAGLQALIEKRDTEEYRIRSAGEARLKALIEKRDTEEYNERAAAGARMKALVERQQTELFQIKAAAQEKQRSLNASFLTSPIASQLATAEKAAVYTSLGGNASEKYGSAAAAADIAALRRQHELLPAAVRGSQSAMESHNHTMQEAHALTRGLAGSLGGLWLTYGSLIPIAAGAAIASSLKQVMEVGKDVEYQLQFVAALSKEAVPLDDFLHVTAGTVTGVKEAAEGMRALAQNGLSVKESLSVLPAVLNLAVIGELSVEQAALAATGALSAFGLQIGEIGRVGDILAQTAASSNTSVRALTESLKQASVASSLYHVSIEETAAALGTLAKINITGAAAGTAYNNLLTSIYAPTAMAARALKQLGVEAKNTDGSLKNSSLVLAELRNALSGYNEAQQARFIGDITTNRGAKAVSTLLQYLDEYDKKIGEAKDSTGFMSEAVMKLEDSVEGSFRRLKNSSDRTWVKAFAQVSPAVQGLTDELAHLAGSDGAIKLMANLADFAIKGVTALVDNAKAVGVLVLAYAGFSTIVGVWKSITSAIAVYEAAMVTATTVTAAARVGMSLWLGVLGPIGLALAGVTLAWSLYTHEVDKVEQADQKIRNSIQNNIDFLKNETEAIRARNSELDKKVGIASGLPSGQDQAKARVADLEQRVADAQAALLRANREGTGGDRLSLGVNLTSLRKQLADAKRQYFELEQRQEENDIEVQIEQGKIARNSLIKQLEEFSKRGDVIRTIAGQAVAVEDSSNAAARAKAKEANQILQDYTSGTKTAEQATAEFIIVRRQYNELLKGAAPKTNNDQLKATQESYQLELKLFEIKQKTSLMQLDASRGAGQVGELEYLRKKNELEKASLNQAVLTAQKEMGTVADLEKKQAAYQKFKNAEQEAKEKSRQLDIQLAVAEDNYLEGLRTKNLAAESENYAKRGQLLDAFLTKFESENGKTISQLRADLAGVDLESLGQALAIDPSNAENLRAYNTALQQTLRLKGLMDAQDMGVNDAVFGMSSKSFDKTLTDLKSKLAQAKATATEDGGISGALGLQAASDDLRAGLLLDLDMAVMDMHALAEAFDNADLKAKADAAGKSLADVTKELSKASQPFGNMWDDTWKAIERGAHDAWMNIGKQGESIFKSIGKVIKTSIMEMLYQLTIKKWLINIGASISRSLGGEGGALSGISSLAGGGSAGSAGGTVSSLLGAVNAAKNIYGAITGGFGNTVASGLSYLQTAAGSTYGTAAASQQSLMLAAQESGMGAAAGSTASTVGNVVGTVANVAGGIAGGVYGGRLISGGYSAFGGSGNTAVNAGTAVGAVVGNIVPVIGTAIGALVGGLLGGAVNRLFGMKPKEVTAQGIRGQIDAGGASGFSYDMWSQKGGLFRSDKSGVDATNFSQEMINSLGSGLSSLKSVTEGLGQTLGIATGSLADYQKFFDVTLESTDPAKVQESLTKLFTEISDELATKLVPNIAEFAKVGETASTTLERLATDFKATDVVAQILGKTGAEAFGAAGLASVKAREQFVNLSGGLDVLNANMTSFAANYLTDAEKLAPVAKSLDAALAGLSLTSIPKTRDEFKALVQGLDLTDASQVKLFTSLMALQDAFAQVHPAAEKAADAIETWTPEKIASQKATLQEELDTYLPADQLLAKQRDAVHDSNKAIFDQIQLEKARAAVLEERKTLQEQLDGYMPEKDQIAKQRAAITDETNRQLFDQIQAHKALQEAYQAESTALQEAIDKSQSFADSLKSFREGLLLSDKSPLTPEQRYAEARKQYETTLVAAQGGDEKAQQSLADKANAFLEASKVSFASSDQYVADFNLVREQTAQLESWASQQVNIGKASLAALDKQVAGLVDVKTAVLSVTEAINNLATAMGPAGAAMQNKSWEESVKSLYQSLLGRAPDAEGLSYWMNQLKGGATIGQVGQGIGSGPEGIVRSLYQQILGRDPEAAGQEYWANLMKSGVSFGTIFNNISSSPEAQSRFFDPTSRSTGGADWQAYFQAVQASNNAMLEEIRLMRAQQPQLVAAQVEAQYDATNLAADKTVNGTAEALSKSEWAAKQEAKIS